METCTHRNCTEPRHAQFKKCERHYLASKASEERKKAKRAAQGEAAAAQGLMICNHPSCPLGPQPPAEFIDDSGKEARMCRRCRTNGKVHDKTKRDKQHAGAAGSRTSEDKTCAQCKETRPLEEFVKRRGAGESNNCDACRIKNTAKSEERRQKKRVEMGDEAFLKMNAERMVSWRRDNHAKVLATQRSSLAVRVCGIRQQAKAKGVPVSIDARTMKALVTLPCFYCDLQPDDRINGIDRICFRRPYSPGFVVSCCRDCNFLKKALDPATFRERCIHIATDEKYPEAWDARVPRTTYEAYRARAEKKGLKFELTRQEFDEMRMEPCLYCQAEPAGGVDRRDNNNYSLEECCPCCSECNQMKGDMAEEKFIAHCARVAAHFSPEKLRMLPDVPFQPRVICKRGDISAPSDEQLSTESFIQKEALEQALAEMDGQDARMAEKERAATERLGAS